MGQASSDRVGVGNGPLRALIIEDCPEDVEVCLHTLKKARFAVELEVAQTPEELLERVHSKSYDVVLSDYRLPGWTGIDALEIVRKDGKNRDAPFILITGSLGEEMAVECLKQGVSDYVLKDQLARLPVAVLRALDEKRLRSERTRAEEELNQFFILSLEMLGILGFDGYARRLNPAWEQVLGFTAQELQAQPCLDFLHPEDQPAALAQLRKLTAGASVNSFEIRCRARNGSYRWILVNAFPALERELIYVAARDITERKQVEEAACRLAAIVESSTDAIIGTTLEGIVLSWNCGAEGIYGYTAQEALGRPLSFLASAERNGELQELLGKVRQGGSVRQFETVAVKKDGSHIHVSLTISPVRDAAGRLVGFSEIAHDITARKRLEERLRRKNRELAEQNRRVEEASRMKSEFLANMSHELRSPLNGIIGFTELMYDGKLGPVSAENREYLGDVLTSGRHLLQLINDVLDLAKVEAGRLELRPEPVPIDKLVREVVEVLHALAVKKRLRVATSVASNVGELVVDPSKLKQVLYNYLSNAVKFTPHRGRIWVRVRPEGPSEFRLEVEDTGIGIRPEDIPRLFREFQQLDAGAGKRYPGTGLGLALTKRIVEAQGGRVGVRSTPGQGSLFFAILPRRAQVKAATATSFAPPILVIEGDASERSWLAQILKNAGYAVETAATGAAALAKCQSKAYACITLDLLLPDANGWEVLAAIRSRALSPEVPAIVVSMVAQNGTDAALPVQDFLTKPVEPAALLAALTRAGVQPKAAAASA